MSIEWQKAEVPEHLREVYEHPCLGLFSDPEAGDEFLADPNAVLLVRFTSGIVRVFTDTNAQGGRCTCCSNDLSLEPIEKIAWVPEIDVVRALLGPMPEISVYQEGTVTGEDVHAPVRRADPEGAVPYQPDWGCPPGMVGTFPGAIADPDE